MFLFFLPQQCLENRFLYIILWWVQGAACSLEFLPWYSFWQDEKTYFSSFFSWLSREHFWKWRLCSRKARLCICMPHLKAKRLYWAFDFSKQNHFQSNSRDVESHNWATPWLTSSFVIVFCRWFMLQRMRPVFFIICYLLSVACKPPWTWTVMKQSPCPGAKDSPLDEAAQSLMDEGEGAQEDKQDSWMCFRRVESP